MNLSDLEIKPFKPPSEIIFQGCAFPVEGGCGAEAVDVPGFVKGYADVCEYHVFWRSKDGTITPIRELSDRHLYYIVNKLAKIASSSFWTNIQSKFLFAEARRRNVWTDGDLLAEKLMGEAIFDRLKFLACNNSRAGLKYPSIIRIKPLIVPTAAPTV